MNLSFSQIVIIIMTIFMILGGIDRMTHGKLKLGLQDSFNEGFEALGALALSMLGILALAPAMVNIVMTLVGPVYNFIGADPAMFAGTLLGCDMGAYPLAKEMADNSEVYQFSGLILGSQLGAIISFTIPVGIGIIEEEDRQYFAKGILFGTITIPIGAFAGGLAAGFDIGMLLINSVPTIVISILIALGIKFIPNGIIKGFNIFGKFIISLITFGLICAAIEALIGIQIIKGMAPISEGFAVIGNIAIVLAGAFPLLHLITRVFSKNFEQIGEKIGVNAASVAGLVACLANAIPMMTSFKNMDERGKVINSAFAVSGAFILGDHLAFVASVDREMIGPVIVAKAIGGITAVLLAYFAMKKPKLA